MTLQSTQAVTPTIFNFDTIQVRTIMKGDEPWFIARDVAEALGYANPSEAVQDNCKRVEILKTSQALPWVPTRGYQIIPERDVYRLIMKSQLPSAERFEEWVVGEVLPTIRKTGSYNLPQTYAQALEHLLVEVKYREENAHKVDFFDAVAESSDLILIREVSKVLAVPLLGQNTLFRILRDLHILMIDNEPYQKYVDRGLFMVRERKYTVKGEVKIGRTTMVTQKGLDFIRKIVTFNMDGGMMRAPARWEMPGSDGGVKFSRDSEYKRICAAQNTD